MDGLQALALAKKYTKDTSDSLGSLKGAPCRIKSIEQLEEGSKVTFEWEGKSGTLETNYIILKNGPKGKDGVGISDISKSGSEELIDTYTITLSNDETYEFQVKNGKDGERGFSINGCSFNEKGELVITLENGVALPGVMLPSASVSISKETNNIISQRDDGLYVPKTNLEEYIKAETVENTFVKKEEGKSLVSDEDIQSISESKAAIGEIENIEVKSWTDIVTAINALYNSTVTKIECSGTKLKVTFADKEPEEVDVSSIISTSKLGDLQNVDDSEVTSGQVLAYDSESSKYKPKTFDLAAVLTQAKAYTDREITNSVKNHSIACDEKPVYNDGEKPTITYILNGITYETEATETWFFYHVDGDTFQTKWVSGVEFTIDALDTDFTQFVQKTDIANSYTGEEIDKTKIASLKALDDLAKNVSGLPEPEAKDKLLLVTENDSKLEWTQVDKDEVGEDIPVYTTEEYEQIKDTIPEGTKFIISDDYQEEVDNDYQEKINSHVYTQIGVVNGCEPGYLRQLNKPKKIVVIGNSITMHGRREADGIEWTVDDYREMAAEHPNTGWVGLLKRYISEYINPDCEVWKANGSTWEVQPNGTRKYEHMADMTCAQVFDDGPNYRSDVTIDKILDKDVDIVIFQLSENCAEPTTDQAITDMATDFMRLYIAVARKCPKAKIYEFCGFWQNLNKTRAMVGACFNTGVVPIQPLTFLEGFNTEQTTSMQSSPGTKIYDANENVIATVSGAVAGHPGDQGFQVMAAYVINALYNEITYSSDQKVLLFSRNSKYNAPDITEMFHTGEDGSLETVNELYAPYFDYFLTPGRYTVTISYGSAGTHGYLDVKSSQITAGNLSTFRKIEEEEALKQKCSAYLTLMQRYTSINNDVPSIERKVVLSALNTVFRPFYIPSPPSPIIEYENLREVKLNKTLLGYDCYSVAYVIPNDIVLSPSTWTYIFSFSSSLLHIPRHILSFNIVGDTSARVIDNRTNVPGYRYLIDDYGNLNMASNLYDEDQTILKDSVLIIEYSAR